MLNKVQELLTRRWRGLLLGTTIVLPPLLVWGPLWFMKIFMGGFATTWNDYGRGLERNFSPNYRTFWFALAAYLVLIAGVAFVACRRQVTVEPTQANSYQRQETTHSPLYVRAGLILGALAIVCTAIYARMDINNKDKSRAYNEQTEFVVRDLEHPPELLNNILNGATKGGQDCALRGPHDIPSCITQGELPREGWEPRAASLAGAQSVMSRVSGGQAQVDLIPLTLTHIYPRSTDPVADTGNKTGGYWTALRDGKETITSLEGVVEWNGRDDPTLCKFDGQYELKRSFRGHNDNDLNHLIAEQFAPLWYREEDIYGYCDRTKGENTKQWEPIVVIPMLRNVAAGHTSVEMPGGVVIMHGTQSGMPRFEFKTVVKPGDMPGPVYPLSLAMRQREENYKAAGRGLEGGFGFETTAVTSQGDNASEYLLRSRADGRTYWVTPLTPRHSDSQQSVAYMVIPADELTPPQLNRARMYVLREGDPGIANLVTMTTQASDIIRQEMPGFFTDPSSRVEEYVPAADGNWRAYGNTNGQPILEIVLSPTGATAPKLERMPSKFATPTQPTGGTNPAASPSTITTGSAACGKSIGEMTGDEMIMCQGAIADEQRRRLQQPPGTTK